MGAVADAVGDVVGGVVDAVGDVVDTVGDAVEDVGNAVVDVVDSALENPVQTIVTIAAVAAAPATGGASLYAIPATSAATVLDNGGSFDDALKAAAISYVATTAGGYVAPGAGSYAAELGADAATQAAVQGATRAVVSGATRAALSGGDIGDAMVRSLAGYGLSQGIDYAINEAGQAIDNMTGEVLADSDGTMSSSLTGEEGINAMDIAGVSPEESFDGMEVGTDIDAFGNEIGDTNPYAADIGATGDVPTFQDSYVGISEGSPDGDMPEFGSEEYKYLPEAEVPVTDAAGDSTFQQDQLGISESSPDGDMPEVGTDVDAFGNEITDTNPYAATYEAGVDYPMVDQAEIDAAPDAIDMDAIPEGDNALVEAAKKYFQKQVTGRLTSNLMKDIFGTGAPKPPPRVNYGGNYLPSGMSDLSTGVNASMFGTGSESDGSSLADAEPTVDLGSDELFNPLGDATWAPQSKIGGLGFAGKYLNRDADTYYVSKEQEDRQKALEKLQSQPGWMTDEERQQLLNEAGVQNPSEASPFFDAGSFDPYDLTYAAGGGLMGHNPEFYSEGGASVGNRYVKGRGDGTSDSVPAMLASGEFVIPADVVSGLGNGDNDAGAKVLDNFMEEIRKHKRGGSPKQLPPDSLGPLSYLSSAMTKAKRK